LRVWVVRVVCRVFFTIQRIGAIIGHLDQASMKRLAVALRFWIDVWRAERKQYEGRNLQAGQSN